MARVAPMWFRKRTQPLWEQYIKPLASQIKTYMEIGCGEGGSERWVLENLPVELAVSVDPFMGSMAGRDVSARLYLQKWLPPNMEPEDSPLRIVKEQSLFFLSKQIAENADEMNVGPKWLFDFIYIDGDHDSLPVLTDCVLAWQLLKQGGIMACDDWERTWKNTHRHGLRPGTKEGINGFLTAAHGQWEKVFEEVNQICIRRL